MNLEDDLWLAAEDSGRPDTLDLDTLVARGRARRGRRRAAMAATAAAVVAVAGVGVGVALRPTDPVGTADCATVVRLDGRTYSGHGELMTTPPTTGVTRAGVVPGCNDTGADEPAPDEEVQVQEIEGVPLDTAVLFGGQLYLAEGEILPDELRGWFRRPSCAHDGSTNLTGRWLAVRSEKKVRFDGDVRPPLRIDLWVERTDPTAPAYDGWRVVVHDSGAAEPGLTPDDVRDALWDDALLSVRVHCDGDRFVADGFEVLR